MSDMIEKMARVLHDNDMKRTAYSSTWDAKHDWAQQKYFDDARAALTALREPTDEMRLQIASVLINNTTIHTIPSDEVDEIWQAGVDAALDSKDSQDESS